LVRQFLQRLLHVVFHRIRSLEVTRVTRVPARTQYANGGNKLNFLAKFADHIVWMFVGSKRFISPLPLFRRSNWSFLPSNSRFDARGFKFSRKYNQAKVMPATHCMAGSPCAPKPLIVIKPLFYIDLRHDILFVTQRFDNAAALV
jgi:hypothetical protein